MWFVCPTAFLTDQTHLASYGFTAPPAFSLNPEVFSTSALSVFTEIYPPLDFDIHFRVFPRTRYLLLREGPSYEVFSPSTLPKDLALASLNPIRRARKVASFPGLPSVARREWARSPGGSFSTLSVLGLRPSKFFTLNPIDVSSETSLLPCLFQINEPSSRSLTLQASKV